MIDSDKAKFKSLIESSMAIYSVELDVNVIKIWWAALQRMPLEHVTEAFSRYLQNPKKGRYAPKPADILGILEEMAPDGRIGAEEAWALYPHDEASSAVITDEMAEAMQVARPLLEEGDPIAARMAFKEAYTRITAQNKFNGISPKWFPSLGHSREGREEALKLAVEKKRLTAEHAQSLLPPPASAMIANMVSEMKLLTASEELTPEQKAKNHERIQAIKGMLK